MTEHKKTILLAAAIGAPLTGIGIMYSFWLAHNSVALTLLIVPGVAVAPALGGTGIGFWPAFVVVQVVYYLAVTFGIKMISRNQERKQKRQD